MGYGDDLIITSHASKIKKKFPDRQIVIGSVLKKQAYHSIMYDNNPNISDCNNLDLKKPIHIIDYHPGNRPYIDYKNSTNTKYIWNKNFKVTPGEIYFSKEEINEANKIILEAKKYWNSCNNKKFRGLIFFEPSSTKIDNKQFGTKQQNKDWGYKNWNHLANILNKDFLLIQSVHSKSKIIKNIFNPGNLDFRLACAVMNNCDIYLGLEGGFVQAAGALKKKAVIYFGGWISPEIIGYDFHENIYYDDKFSPCGEYFNFCSHCEDARKSISTNLFLEKIEKIFKS